MYRDGKDFPDILLIKNYPRTTCKQVRMHITNAQIANAHKNTWKNTYQTISVLWKEKWDWGVQTGGKAANHSISRLSEYVIMSIYLHTAFLILKINVLKSYCGSMNIFISRCYIIFYNL